MAPFRLSSVYLDFSWVLAYSS